MASHSTVPTAITNVPPTLAFARKEQDAGEGQEEHLHKSARHH